jgi:hypothetical protein
MSVAVQPIAIQIEVFVALGLIAVGGNFRFGASDYDPRSPTPGCKASGRSFFLVLTEAGPRKRSLPSFRRL